MLLTVKSKIYSCFKSMASGSVSGLNYILTGALRQDIQSIITMLKQEKLQMAQNQQDLDNQIAAEGTLITQVLQTVKDAATQLDADLKALEAKTPAGADFSTEIQSMQAQVQALQGLNAVAATLQADDTSVQGQLNPPASTPPASGDGPPPTA